MPEYLLPSPTQKRLSLALTERHWVVTYLTGVWIINCLARTPCRQESGRFSGLPAIYIFQEPQGAFKRSRSHSCLSLTGLRAFVRRCRLLFLRPSSQIHLIIPVIHPSAFSSLCGRVQDRNYQGRSTGFRNTHLYSRNLLSIPIQRFTFIISSLIFRYR